MSEKRTRQEPITVVVAPTSQSDVAFSIEEEKEYNDAYALLSQQQIQSARLESAGIVDRNLIATKLKVTPQTITNWRDEPAYQKIIKLCTSIVDRVGRQFRADCVRHIIAPAYVELINRMSDPEETKGMPTKELVDLVTKMTKEIRLDTIVATDDDDEEANNIADLQRRRKMILAEQARGVSEIQNNSNIIQFPDKKALNG